MAQSAAGLTIMSNTVSIDGSNVSAFGDLVAVPHTPLFQFDFVPGINSQTGTSITANSATVDTSAFRLRLQTGTNSAGSAFFRSVRVARYRPGQGICARFTPIFTTGVASSTQIMGMGVASPTSATTTDGYFFGYNGTSFGILHRNQSSDTWTAQASWNGDKLDGTGASGVTWDPTKGTPVQIRYPYLGYGQITFWVQNPTTGAWILAHSIRYPNTTATIQLGQPSMYFVAHAVNSGNTSNLTMYCGSVGVFLAGTREFKGAQFALNNNKASIATETNILTIRNCSSYNGAANMGVIRLRSVSAGSDGATSGVTIVKLIKGTTLGGSPSYAAVSGSTADSGVTITSGSSIASYDTAGTTITGGTVIWNTATARNQANFCDLTPFDLMIMPGETATFSITNGNNATAVVAVNWQEDV
jgi:hypothetical protein